MTFVSQGKHSLTSFLLSPWWIVLLGVAVRLIYALQFSQTPFWSVTSWDADEYFRMAYALSQSKGDLAWHYRPLLYPFLLGILFILAGAHLTLIYFGQAVLGVINGLIVRTIGERLFSPTGGVVAGSLMVVSGVGLHFEFQVLPTILSITLMLISLWLWTKGSSDSRWLFGSGLGAGLSSLTWPLMIVILPALTISLSGRRLVTFLIGGSIPLMINFSLHQFLLRSGPILLSGQGGVNFYIGNSPTSQGFTAYLPGVGPGWDWTTLESLARYETNLPLKPAEVDRHFWKKGWETIRSDPKGWASLLIRKAGLFWSRVEISNTEDFYHLQHSVSLLKILLPIGVPLMLPFAVWGGWRRRKIKEVKILVLLGGGFFLLSTLFFINARFRYPIYPLLAILGAAGIQDFIGFIKQRAFRKRIGDWGVGVLLTGLSIYLPFATPLGFDPQRQEYGFFTEGVAWEKLGELEKARWSYQEALDRNPATPYAHLSLARIAWARKEGEKALYHCRRELEILPTNGRAWALMGMIKEEYGDLGEALAAYRKAVEYRPELAEIYPRAQTLIRILSRSLPPDDPRQNELLNLKAWFEHRGKSTLL